VALAGDPVAHLMAAMRRQAVPDEQHWPLLRVRSTRSEVDQQFVVIGAGRNSKTSAQHCHPVRRPVRRRVTAVPLKRWRSTGVQRARPGGAYRRQAARTPDHLQRTINAFWRLALFQLWPAPFAPTLNRRSLRSVAWRAVSLPAPVQPMPQDVPDAATGGARHQSHVRSPQRPLQRPQIVRYPLAAAPWSSALSTCASCSETQLRQPSGSFQHRAVVPAGTAARVPPIRDNLMAHAELAPISAGPTPCSNKSAAAGGVPASPRSRVAAELGAQAPSSSSALPGLFDIGQFPWIATLPVGRKIGVLFQNPL